MKIAICYSGQLRLSRFLHSSHIKHLFAKLCKDHDLHLFFYTDNINTTRYEENNNICWKINNEDITKQIKQLVNYYSKFCSTSRLEIEDFNIKESKAEYNLNLFDKNLNSQLNKFINVLELAKQFLDTKDIINSKSIQYDIVIRLRPDIVFMSDISTEFLNTIKNTNKFIQSIEQVHSYNSDSIQIFNGIYLEKIIEISKTFLNCGLSKNYSDCELNKICVYEQCINNIATKSGLILEYVNNICGRWYYLNTTYYPGLCWIYFKDWENIEYKNNFDKNLLNLITSQKLIIKSTSLSDKDKLLFNISDPNAQLYCSAMRFDYIEKNNIYKPNQNLIEACEIEFAGLIPCAGTATRMGGLPKFLLPSANDTLINNTISHYRSHFFNKIYIGFSHLNMQYFPLLNNEYNDLVPIDVNSTATMSETVIKMTSQINTAKNYILFMPDTYFILDRELVQMMQLLHTDDPNYDVVVIVWKIRPEQYGKLGQCLIENSKVIDIKDKDPECRYEYSWGVIGWNSNMTQYIDPVTPHVGFLINTALANGKNVGAIISDSIYYDCGTYNEYFQMIKKET